MTMPEHTDTMVAIKPKLGVAKIIRDTFFLFLRGFVFLALFGTVMEFVRLAVSYLFEIQVLEPITGGAEVNQFPASLLLSSLDIAGNAISIQVLIAAAFDIRLDRPPNIGRYFKTAIFRLFPMFLFLLLSWFGQLAGASLFVVPGLYLAAMWSVGAPVIVIENAGFNVLYRSAALTKNYRWSIVGLILIVLIILFFLLLPILILSGGWVPLHERFPDTGFFGSIWSRLFVLSTISGPLSGWYAAGTVTLYLRLKEIKEGSGPDQFSAVFD